MKGDGRTQPTIGEGQPPVEPRRPRNGHRRRRDRRPSLPGNRRCRGVPPQGSGKPHPLHRHRAGPGKTDTGHPGFPAADHTGGGDQGTGAGAGRRGARKDPRGPFRLLPDPPRIRAGNRSRRRRVRLGAGGPGRPGQGNGDRHRRTERLSRPDQPDPGPFRRPDLSLLCGIATVVPGAPDTAHRESDPRRIPRGKTVRE